MKRFIATVLATAFAASAVYAEEAITVTKEKAASSECASACASEKGCPIELAMGKLPKLTYKVGKEETCCAVSAAELAKKHDAPMKFVVAEKSFAKKGEAMLALASATEKFVADFATTSECKVSGKFTVAGKELCCSVMAGQRAELAKKAMSKVEMAYLVGEKECACPTQAASLAKESGKDKLFVVAGEKTGCSVTARVKLAQAKYKAAVEALAKADAPAEKKAEVEKS